MRAFLVFLLFCVYALVARWYYVCEIKQLCEDPVENIRLQTLQLTEEDTVLLSGYDQFAFDSTNVRPRLNANNELFLDTVADLMNAFPEKNLKITGDYLESEADLEVGFYENIGVARAAEARKLLMRRGIAEDRIALDYRLSRDSVLREPLAFELYVPEEGPEAFENTQFSFTNMTFSDANFAFDSDEFRPGDPFIAYADSVKTYLALNPEESLRIIGHTDSVGTQGYNQDLGLRRAKNARQYFKDLGVVTEIEVESAGETRPVAPNSTEEGRQKNRRVNFVIEEE